MFQSASAQPQKSGVQGRHSHNKQKQCSPLTEALGSLCRAVGEEADFWTGLSKARSFPSGSLLEAGRREYDLAENTADWLDSSYRRLLGIEADLKRVRQSQEVIGKVEKACKEAEKDQEKVIDQGYAVEEAAAEVKLAETKMRREAHERKVVTRIPTKKSQELDKRKASLQKMQKESWSRTQQLLQDSQLYCPEMLPQVLELCLQNAKSLTRETTDQFNDPCSPARSLASDLQSVLVYRKKADYIIEEILSQTRHTVFKAKHDGQACVLKQVSLSSGLGAKRFWEARGHARAVPTSLPCSAGRCLHGCCEGWRVRDGLGLSTLPFFQVYIGVGETGRAHAFSLARPVARHCLCPGALAWAKRRRGYPWRH